MTDTDPWARRPRPRRYRYRRPSPATAPDPGGAVVELEPGAALVGDDVLAAMPKSGILHDYVCWAVRETYAPPVYHLGAILPAWAWTVARWGWSLPVRDRQVALQSFLIGPPASAKSTALRKAHAFHEEFTRRWEADETVRPWLEAEGTVAGLIEHLADLYDHDRELTAAILFHEEVSSLFAQGGPVVDILMQLFDAKPFVERQLVRYRQARSQGQRTPHRIDRPAIGGVFCATLKSTEETLSERHFEGGLVSRSLWFTGRPDMERFFSAAPAPESRRRVLDGWTQLGRYLPAQGHQGGGSVVRASKVCKEVLEWTLYPRMKAAEQHDLSSETASLQRGMLLAQTIAGLYALSCGRTVIEEPDIVAAVRLVEMSLENVTMLLGNSAVHELYRMVEKADRAIRRAGSEGIGRSELNRKHLRLPKGMLDQVIAQLEEERGIATIRNTSGGRPRDVLIAREAAKGGGVVIAFPTRPPDF